MSSKKGHNSSLQERRSFDIDILDDCWVLIFNLLPLKKRIQLENVSPKWKGLMPYANISSADLADFIWFQGRMIERQFRTQQAPKMVKIVREEDFLKVLMAILSRCGAKLTRLDLRVTDRAQFDFVLCLNEKLGDLIIKNAPNLVRLGLSGCTVSLSCVTVLRGMSKLEELLLDGVIFTENDFSSSIRDLEALKTALSSTIRSLPGLTKFCLNSLSELSPAIHNASLREIRMVCGRSLTAAGVQDLVLHCPNLESLDLQIYNYNKYLDLQMYNYNELGALGRLNKLKNLLLHHEFLSSAELAWICRGCPNLEKLDLHVGKETSCAELGRLTQLKHLYIEGTDFFGWGITTLGGIPVDDAILASVAKYGLLETVWLPRANLTDDGLRSLAVCQNLVKLRIHGIRAITDKGMKAVLEHCQRLEYLEIADTSIGVGTMVAIGAKGISLRRVEVQGTSGTDSHCIRLLVNERVKRLVEGAVPVPLWIIGCGNYIQYWNTVSLTVFN